MTQFMDALRFEEWTLITVALWVVLGPRDGTIITVVLLYFFW